MRVALLLLLIFSLLVPAYAVDQSALGRFVTVDRLIESPFPVSDALLFIDFHDGTILRVNSLVVPVEESSGKNSFCYIGAKVKLPSGTTDLTLSAIVLGTAGQVFVAPPAVWQMPRDSKGPLTTDLLRAHVVEQEGVLKSWAIQMDAQKDSLRRLRADAEVIADVGKILDVREEMERLNSEILAIEKDIEALKGVLREVKTLPNPRNFAQREVQLTQQLTELASLARLAETGELQRRTEVEGDLQRRLEIVESTRFDDVESLQKMYDRLLQRIANLESPANPIRTE